MSEKNWSDYLDAAERAIKDCRLEIAFGPDRRAYAMAQAVKARAEIEAAVPLLDMLWKDSSDSACQPGSAHEPSETEDLSEEAGVETVCDPLVPECSLPPVAILPKESESRGLLVPPDSQDGYLCECGSFGSERCVEGWDGGVIFVGRFCKKCWSERRAAD